MALEGHSCSITTFSSALLAIPEAVVTCHDLDDGATWTGEIFRGQRSRWFSSIVGAARQLRSIVVVGYGLPANPTANAPAQSRKSEAGTLWIRSCASGTATGSFRSSTEALGEQSLKKANSSWEAASHRVGLDRAICTGERCCMRMGTILPAHHSAALTDASRKCCAVTRLPIRERLPKVNTSV